MNLPVNRVVKLVCIKPSCKAIYPPYLNRLLTPTPQLNGKNDLYPLLKLASV
jgi:hypothetical protein